MFHGGFSLIPWGRHQSACPARRDVDPSPSISADAPQQPEPPPQQQHQPTPRSEAPEPTRIERVATLPYRPRQPRRDNPHWTIRYGVAAACAMGATVLTLLLWQHVLSRNPFALFYAAVMLSAWYGGLGPGLLATAFSVLAIDTFLLPSFVSPVPGSQELVQVAIFGGVALLISSLNAMRKRALRERDGLIMLEQAAREEAERARRRTALLADASHALGASIDSPAALGAVAERVVPEFADWCAIDVVADPDAGSFHRIVIAGPGGRPPCVVRFQREYALSENAGGVARVIRTGLPEVVTDVNAASLADLADREPSMLAFVECAAASYLIVPLRASGRTLGAISLLSSDAARRTYGSADLRLADDLAHRLGVALDNHRLFREAQDANRMKDEFLAVVSHELRTPLNAILGWSQLLAGGALDEPSVAQGVGAIERNARAQARIIDDVLDVSRIIQGKLRLDTQPTRLRDVIAEAIEVVRPAAEGKGIRLHADLDCGGRPGQDRVTGDAERLRQVAWNLLSNAIKFTPDGGRVEVTLTREEPITTTAAADDSTPDDSAPGAHVVLRVRDTGKGIDARFLPHVFERFRQADSSSTRAHGGLGLGLAIVRYLVELHGGTVGAESDGPGKGATFTVRLPAESRPTGAASRPTDPPPADVTNVDIAAPAHPELVGLRVLLVEDEPDAREIFSNMLEHCGATVEAVESAHDAIAAFRARRPDVLLSDIGMAGEDGYALIRQVRALEAEQPAAADPAAAGHTPAMAITAFAGAADRTRALREGYQMHVPKPIGAAQFAAAVAALTRINKQKEFPPPP